MTSAEPRASNRIAPLAGALHASPVCRYLRDPNVLTEVAARWCDRSRAWHGPQHLLGMLSELRSAPVGHDRDVLLLAAIYHDAIYDPRAPDNEEKSAALLRAHACDPHDAVVVKSVEIILASKWAQPAATPLIQQFFELDSWQLSDGCPLGDRLHYEQAIFREYQWADWSVYRNRRREFLERWARQFPQHRRGVNECLDLLDGWRPRIGIYPGSFAPFHRGHLSILRQAESIFDKVIVAVGVNRQKSGAVESAHARFHELQARLRYHEVATFDGLLTQFVSDLPFPATIVRGVRDGTDLEAELRFVRFLNELRPQTGVVWISCEAELQHLSSSAIRELEAIEPGAGARYVPDTTQIYDLIPAPG